MAIPQAKFREIVFQLLYCHCYGHASESDQIELIMKELSVAKSAVRLALARVAEVNTLCPKIDAAIAATSQSYNFQRIQSVELTILRLGVFELCYDDRIPPRVAIAEAMRLARKFGTPESSGFVNAILDNMYKSMQGEIVDPETVQRQLSLMEETETLSQLGYEQREREKMQQDDEATANP